jgi:hypothetical protein
MPPRFLDRVPAAAFNADVGTELPADIIAGSQAISLGSQAMNILACAVAPARR